MRIAMIGHKRIPSREGGIEVVVQELTTRMAKLGHDVTVYNRKGNNVQDKNIKNKNIKEYNGVHIKQVFTFQGKSLNAIVYTIIASIRALFGKFDVIHYHAEGPCSMIWLPHFFRKRTIATIHALDWKNTSKWGGFASKFIKFGEKMAAKYADEIIVLSEDTKEYFLKKYNRQTTYIPNGINKPTIKEAKIIKSKWGLEKDSYILFLARIIRVKGLHYLINAYKQISTDKKLVIAGGASHTEEYLNEIKESIKDDKNIIMTGFVTGDVLDELYSNCYMYCLPSDLEGMPLSLMEAMSYGANVLTSNITACTQVIGNFGTCFKKGNTEDLKEKLEDCLRGNNRKNEKEISNYVLNKYNWDDIVEKTIKLYEGKSVLEEK